MEALNVLTKWETGADPKNPTKVMNIFEASRDTREVVKAHVDLVWPDTAHGSATMLKYFKVFGTKLTNDPTLIAPRNQHMLKHAMLGFLLWNSLMPKFQLEMLTEESLFKNGDNCNGLLLWQLIVEKFNPTTNVSVANLKDKLENAKLDDIRQVIKEFNT
eukprot:13467505-Ditylum_brightwellii.AAC.1